jgi:hypothetical protein
MCHPARELVLLRPAPWSDRIGANPQRVHFAAAEVRPEEQPVPGVGEDHLAIGQLDHVAEHAKFAWQPGIVSQNTLALGRTAGRTECGREYIREQSGLHAKHFLVIRR